MSKATFYIRILNLRNVKNHYKYYVAPGVGTQAANCEAPERTSPTSRRRFSQHSKKILRLHKAKQNLADAVLEGTSSGHAITFDELRELLK